MVAWRGSDRGDVVNRSGNRGIMCLQASGRLGVNVGSGRFPECWAKDFGGGRSD